MSEAALSANQGCLEGAKAAEEALHIDEERFRAFYERTSHQLWAYLSRVTGDRSAADDLVQEAYYRLLRAKLPEMGEAQLKSYLYRTASNLLRDDWRREKREPLDRASQAEATDTRSSSRTADAVETRSELVLAFRRLSVRERELLWLAYAEGSSHKEIAEIKGVRPESVRQLLFRARRKVAAFLRGRAECAPSKAGGRREGTNP